jgi:hypothetical protein
MFVETVQDDANELVINVSLENDHIADIEAGGPGNGVDVRGIGGENTFADLFEAGGELHGLHRGEKSGRQSDAEIEQSAGGGRGRQ